MNSKQNEIASRKLFRRARASYRNKDFVTGFQLPKQAADMDHMEAHEWLGAAYDYGIGTKPNLKSAFRHYFAATRSGSANADYHIGVFYYEGRGVRKNHYRAAEWFRR